MIHSPNRRQFAQSLLAGGAVAATSHLSFAAQRSLAVRKFTLALTPGSIGVQVANQMEVIELAAKYGFESVEPLVEELARSSASQLEELNAVMTAKKLSWAAAGLSVDFRGDEAKFADGMKALPAIAAGLQRAGASRVGTWLMPSHDVLTYRQNFARHALRLRSIAKVLKDQGLRLGLEYVGTQSLLTRAKYPFLHTMAETKELISEIGTGNVGFILDTWHWWTAGDTQSDILSLKNEDVVSVDLNDAPTGIKRELQQDNQRELPAATGVIDVKAFLAALKEIGYDGPVRPEPFNRVLNEQSNDEACAATIAAMKKAVSTIE